MRRDEQADSGRERAADLRGRLHELGFLDRLIGAVRAGESQTLVLSGEAGVGKTALLDYVAGHAPGCRVVHATGVQSEMELAFAGLQQLCKPLLDHLDRLPGPQREALHIAFGLSAGAAPDWFLVGLAVLSLLSDAAEEQPLICLVDDEHWLDDASAQALGFAARRLEAESVGLVFAARQPSGHREGLPVLVIEGLREDDARALLDSVLTGPLDARVRDRVVAEIRGNPLALLELPTGLTPAELAGGSGSLARHRSRRGRGQLPAAGAGASGPEPPAAAGRSGCSRPRAPSTLRVRWTRHSGCWWRWRPDRLTRCGPPRSSACAARSRRSSGAAAMGPGSCSARPGAWSGSMPL